MSFGVLGMDDQGLYRVVGVNSKVNKLIQAGLGEFSCIFYIFYSDPFEL